MGRALCCALFIQIDFKNALNGVSRAALIWAVAQQHPQVPPLVSWLYGQHSNLWVESALLTPPKTFPGMAAARTTH
jgi:hypothetical protein